MDQRSQPSFYSFPTPVTDSLSVQKPVLATGPVTLSEVLLQDLRVERVHAQILNIASGIQADMAEMHQPMLYTVLVGSIALSVTGQKKIVMNAGESALIFYGDAHRLGEGARTVPCQLPVAGLQLDETVAHRSVGEGDSTAMILQTVIDLTYLRKNAHISRAAPDLILMHAAGPQAPDSGTAAFISSFPFPADQLQENLHGPGAMALVSAFANFQLCHALKQWTGRLWGDTLHDIRCPNMRRVAMVVREIHAHPDREWTVSKLARHVGLSRSAFAAAFLEVTGEPPIKFLTRARMERAATLLRTDTISMYEVGQRVGYPIESSFARAFKRYWGIAPRSYSGQATETRTTAH